MSAFSRLYIIDPIMFKLVGNEEIHDILDEFEFRPDRTTDCGVSCHLAPKKLIKPPWTYNRRKRCLLFFLACFCSILLILQMLVMTNNNEDMYESLGEFDSWPGGTTDYRVSCPFKHLKMDVSTFSRLLLVLSLKLVDNEDMHNIFDEFDFRPDRTTTVNCH